MTSVVASRPSPPATTRAPERHLGLTRNSHAVATNSPHLRVTFGQSTFDAEGEEARGPFFSRRLHHPSGASGVTIGRGYDMRHRSQPQVQREMERAGIPPETARWLAQGAGRYGSEARAFVSQHRDSGPLLTLEQQQALFERVTAPEMITDIKRILSTPEVVNQYGAVAWESLPPSMQELVFDLRYRGDYSPAVRRSLQPLLASRDFEGVRNLVANRDFWRRHNVPPARIDARIRLAQRDGASRAARSP